MEDIKFVYVRDAVCPHCKHSDDKARKPIGCIAYKDMGNGSFTYGCSVLHPEDKNKSYFKRDARDAAIRRLNWCLSGNKRDNAFSGVVEVGTDGTINDKIIKMLDSIVQHPRTKRWFKINIPSLKNRLSKKKEESKSVAA